MNTDPTNPLGDAEDALGDDFDEFQPPEPSWGDVIGGLWERLKNPLPRTT